MEDGPPAWPQQRGTRVAEMLDHPVVIAVAVTGGALATHLMDSWAPATGALAMILVSALITAHRRDRVDASPATRCRAGSAFPNAPGLPAVCDQQQSMKYRTYFLIDPRFPSKTPGKPEPCICAIHGITILKLSERPAMLVARYRGKAKDGMTHILRAKWELPQGLSDELPLDSKAMKIDVRLVVYMAENMDLSVFSNAFNCSILLTDLRRKPHVEVALDWPRGDVEV